SRFDLFAKPDIIATGHKVVSLAAPGSLLFETYPSLQVFGGSEQPGAPAQYLTLSGTSMASPMVAGAVASVFEFNPSLWANTRKMVLEFTSRTMPGIDTLTQGAGYLNVNGAERLAGSINTAKA